MSSGAGADIAQMLPQSLRRIARVAGVDAALRLVRELGGTRVWLSGRADNPVVRAIGPEAAAAVLELCRAGEIGDGLRYFDVPRLPATVDHAAIRAAVAAGEAKGRVARRFGVTERWVRKICNELPEEDGRQGSLF